MFHTLSRLRTLGRNTQLQKMLKFKIGSRILLTVNLITNDLLTNGCLGTVVGVQLGDNEEVKEVHVAFDNPEAGKEAAKKYLHLSEIYGRGERLFQLGSMARISKLAVVTLGTSRRQQHIKFP